jgi:hypothetical protein
VQPTTRRAGGHPQPVRDFDLHPDEDGVRVFATEPGGVLRLRDDMFVSAGRYGDVILWHYAFARHWFKVNLTTGLDGHIMETGGDGPARPFAVNCDIATPMRREGSAVYAVDLFTDILVRADGVSYRVCDLAEFGQARRRGLILPAEARGAGRGVAELTGIIERGELVAFLRHSYPAGPLDPPAASPPGRVALSQVPQLSRESRACWASGPRGRFLV